MRGESVPFGVCVCVCARSRRRAHTHHTHGKTKQNYVQARIQRFAHTFGRRINPQLTREQIDYLARETVHAMAAMPEPQLAVPQQSLRLVLRHDCQ